MSNALVIMTGKLGSGTEAVLAQPSPRPTTCQMDAFLEELTASVDLANWYAQEPVEPLMEHHQRWASRPDEIWVTWPNGSRLPSKVWDCVRPLMISKGVATISSAIEYYMKDGRTELGEDRGSYQTIFSLAPHARAWLLSHQREQGLAQKQPPQVSKRRQRI